ncbi:Putative ribonuclease H protein At1g65750 [Linum perenne]
MTPPCSTLDDDTPVWGLEPNGTYSVKSGYLLAKGLAGSGSNGIWKAVWSWKGVTRNIYWKAAQGTSYTLNTDGSVRLSDHVAAAGGCLRDNDGRVIDCFAANLGDCSITRAELTGVINGLDRAWNIGIREVEVQTDSACVVKLLTETMPGNHQHATLIQKFKNISQRAWSVSVKFVYREANHLADFLANKGHELTLGTHTIETSESNVLYWAKYDLVGGSETRTIFI